MKIKYEEMLPNEFLAAIDHMPVFIVPTGLLEWHADHLPLGQDTMKVYGICLELAKALGGGIVLPPNYYGRPGYSSYTGTLTYSEGLLHLLFTELFEQLQKVGAKVVVLLTGHYGDCQVDFIRRVADIYQREHDGITIIAQPEYEGVTVDGESPSDHAGVWETSMFWHFYPDLIRMDLFQDVPQPMKLYGETPPHAFYREPAEWTWGTQDVPRESSPEKGKRAVDAIVAHLVDKINKAVGELH